MDKMHTFSDYASQVNLSPTGKYVLVRVMHNGINYWRVFLKANVLAGNDVMVGKEFTTLDHAVDPLQGFSVMNGIVRLLYGATNAPSRIEKWDIATGKKVSTNSLDKVIAHVKQLKGPGKTEVEGYHGDHFGVKWTPRNADTTWNYNERVILVFSDDL